MNTAMERLTREQRVGRSRDRAKRTIVALVEASGGRLVGKLRLYKAFYKAHLEYFELTGLDLTGYPMVHMPNGPGIDNAQELIDELMEEGSVQEQVGTQNRPKERIYILVKNQQAELDEEKAMAIKRAVTWANSLDEKALKDGSHNRSWLETSQGQAQNIFIDVLTTENADSMRNDVTATVFALSEFASIT